MAFTASCNGRSCICEFLYGILCFVVLTFVVFGTRIGVRILAVIKAFTGLCAYIMRFFEKQPFRFLDLPPEIRNRVYHHHFTLYRTPRYKQQVREMAMLPDAILGVNRQVYEEASNVLYSDEAILIQILRMERFNGGERHFVGKIPHILKHIPTMVLEIRWPHSVWYRWPETGVRPGCSVKGLKDNMKMVCTTLAQLHNLRTIRVAFLVEDSSQLLKISPAKHCIPSLLRPLKLVRRANPGLVVEMPDYCPISTAELAKQQQECPAGPQHEYLTELYEDHKEALEEVVAVGEDLRSTD